MRALTCLSVMVLSSLAFAGGGTAPLKAYLTPTKCHVALPDGFQEGRDATCAYLSVPQRYDQPSSKTFKLFVVRLRPQGPALSSDPVIYLHGGPGGNIDGSVSRLGAQFLKVAGGREVVFFDQRGSGRSTGQLDCPAPPSQVQPDDRSNQNASVRAAFQRYQACRTQLVQAGTDLNAYSSAQIAGDIERLRTALGAAQINLYGISYGTRVAQEVMHRFPGSVRSVVLDSPLIAGWEGQRAPAFSQTLRNAFALCHVDRACQSTYGDLQSQFPAFLKQLDQQPPDVSVIDPGTGNFRSVKLTSGLFLDALFAWMYQAKSPYSLPSVLNPAIHGSYISLLPLIAQLNETETHFSPIGALIACADQPAVLNQAAGNNEAVLPEVKSWGEQSDQLGQHICAALNLKPQSPWAGRFSADLPALILTGGVDPITPPLQGQLLKRMLADSTLINFPMNGHGQAFPGRDSDVCAFRLLQVFWNAPTARLDPSCAAGTVVAQ